MHARAIGVLVAVVLMPGSAVAAEPSPAADRLLWCSSAMYWLAADAFDAGDDTEAVQYEGWSNDLGARADLMLEAEGRTQLEITTIREDYDNTVLAELGRPDARHDVVACPDLAAQ